MLIRTADASTTRTFRVPVGPPAAELSVAIIDPPRSAVRGTIIVLHGIRSTKRAMSGVGRALAAVGFRAVLVDLRGHGESTGDVLSFGATEGKDIAQVVDRLAADGLLVSPLGAYGPSYGGAVALQLARRVPQVRAVVTVATFTRMRDIVPLYAERIAPTWFVTGRDLDRAMDKAGTVGGFDPDEADSVKAIAMTSAEVLLIHGRADAHIPWQHATLLHAAAPDHSRLLLVDGKDHGSIMNDDSALRESIAWFDRWLVRDP
jgi:pimeloyl-ACP methyl ester carboxylesterase